MTCFTVAFALRPLLPWGCVTLRELLYGKGYTAKAVCQCHFLGKLLYGRSCAAAIHRSVPVPFPRRIALRPFTAVRLCLPSDNLLYGCRLTAAFTAVCLCHLAGGNLLASLLVFLIIPWYHFKCAV